MCCEVIRYFLCFIGYFFWFVRCWPYLARYFAYFITYPFFKFSICFNSQPFSIPVKWKFLFCWSQRFCMDHSIGFPPISGYFLELWSNTLSPTWKFFVFIVLIVMSLLLFSARSWCFFCASSLLSRSQVNPVQLVPQSYTRKICVFWQKS